MFLKKLLFGSLILFPLFVSAQFSQQEVNRFSATAKNVTIIRDKWGVPHIYGKTDADAVFGLLYAQCEENFPRVERNYLEMMGRLSEIEGKNSIYDDLEIRLIYDSNAAKSDYQKSPEWFKKLLNAFADGINYFLVTHPNVKPQVLKKFHPWFPLLYTDGSIAPTQTGGLTTQDLLELYSSKDIAINATPKRQLAFDQIAPNGSNGFAIAPTKTANGKTLLYINPHVTFYFRAEVHIVSEEGLNAYGAVTWGQFFVYQGFNEYCGWMHTSSYADVADLYKEQIVRNGTSLSYKYDSKTLPVKTKKISILYKENDVLKEKVFTTYSTHHGPVMGSRGGEWLSLKENNRSLNSLMQSWLRTKAKGFKDFRKVMDMKANNSNNTVFADYQGNIAYWHGNFMPRRNPEIDWTMPVDGSLSSNEWKGVHPLDSIVHVYNPSSGWIQNCNSTPFTSAGESSPEKDKFPRYMAPDGENFRAINAIRLLKNERGLTLEGLIEKVGYNRKLSAFDLLLPALFESYGQLSSEDSLVYLLKEPIDILRTWDRISNEESIATTLAIEWGTLMLSKARQAQTPEQSSNVVETFTSTLQNTTSKERLEFLRQSLNSLTQLYGTWKTPWGKINRYQRTPDKFDDSLPSVPVGLAPGTWGSLPSYASRRSANTINRYGVSGNSFIACVEFGQRLRARTVITGGQSFDPHSPHYTDQAEMFIQGRFKEINFYKEDVMKNKAEMYKPGKSWSKD